MPQAVDRDLVAVANELYGLHPSDFTAARNSRVAEARRQGRRYLAGAVKDLRRPSHAAWAVNLLTRQCPQEVERLTELGAHLREAQGALSGNELRTLGQRRQEVVSGLAQRVRALARENGNGISETIQREVESTLTAALIDADAGAALRSGRLVRSLQHTGMGGVDLDGAVAAGEASLGGEPAPPATSGGGDDTPPASDSKHGSPARRRAAREQAEAEAASAQAAVQAADKELADITEAAAEARRGAEDSAEAVRRLEERLDDARKAAATSAGAATKAVGDRGAAERRADAARRRAQRARARADALGGGVDGSEEVRRAVAAAPATGGWVGGTSDMDRIIELRAGQRARRLVLTSVTAPARPAGSTRPDVSVSGGPRALNVCPRMRGQTFKARSARTDSPGERPDGRPAPDPTTGANDLGRPS